MQDASEIRSSSLSFEGADLEIRASLDEACVTIDIVKSGACVHRLRLSDAVGPLENGWIAELLAREDHVKLAVLARDVSDYMDGLDIRQG